MSVLIADSFSSNVADHAETLALVRVYEIGKNLGGCGDRDAALVTEFVEATLHAEVCEPILTVLYHPSVSIPDAKLLHIHLTAAPPAMVPSN